MHLPDHHIHIWMTDLTIPPDKEIEYRSLLSRDEIARAERFHFEIHRVRFIATHGVLRTLLAAYLDVAPHSITFAYTEHGKPYVAGHETAGLQFNISHSENLAVYAFTRDHAVGIDIEKIQTAANPGIAQRFFGEEEKCTLAALPAEQRTPAFFQLWACKEALIKATGKGLKIPLSSFSVSLAQEVQRISLENVEWQLMPLDLHPGFQAAVASNQSFKVVYNIPTG